MSEPHENAFEPLPRSLSVLVVIIGIIEILASLSDYGLLVSDLRRQALLMGAFWNGILQGGAQLFPGQSWTMFVTHAFLHGSLLHMVMNMAIFLALGRFVADRFGGAVILPSFFACAIGGAVAYALISNSNYPMVGASGAVFGFFGIWIAWDLKRHWTRGASLQPVIMRVLVLAGINVVFYFMLDGRLAWEAHLGGFVTGVIIGVYLVSNRRV